MTSDLNPAGGARLRLVDLAEVSRFQTVGWLLDLAASLEPDTLLAEGVPAKDPAATLVAAVSASSRAWVVLDGDVPLLALGFTPATLAKSAGPWVVDPPRLYDHPAAAHVAAILRPVLEQSPHVVPGAMCR